ncbi:hypothetical protein TUM16656_48370 [Klebsiella pneumoniae]|nr:hypothetical protein TUM16656_48370 [Klebsiella pneumoniae]GJK82874.1 hypothetical protein TUM17566_49260 [Klebsiella pneumoniae]
MSGPVYLVHHMVNQLQIKKMIMEKYEVFLAEEKLGKTSLHATSEEMTKFIEDNHPEYL